MHIFLVIVGLNIKFFQIRRPDATSKAEDLDDIDDVDFDINPTTSNPHQGEPQSQLSKEANIRSTLFS